MTYLQIPIFKFADDKTADLIGQVTVHRCSDSELILESDEPISRGEEVMLIVEQEKIAGEIAWSSGRIYGCTRTGTSPTFAALGEAPDEKSAAQPKQTAAKGRSAKRRLQFSSRFAAIRRSKGLTLADIANAIGVSKPTIWAWENGKALPLPERLQQLAAFLDVPLAELQQLAISGDTIPESSRMKTRSDVVDECRQRIADTFNLDPISVKIAIEL